MSDYVMATLVDGSQVPHVLAVTTLMGLEDLFEENLVAVFDLVKRCQDANYSFPAHPYGDSKRILTEWRFMYEGGLIDKRVAQIVLNAVQVEGASIRLVNPFQTARVSVIERKR